MFKNVLFAVQEALANVPGVAYIAKDWGQLDVYTDAPPVEFPCVLIDVQMANYADRGRHSQQGEAFLIIRVAVDKPVNAFAGDPPFLIFDLLTDIYKVLQGLSGTAFSRLTRTKLRKTVHTNAIRETVMTFRFGFVDDSALLRMHPITAGAHIILR